MAKKVIVGGRIESKEVGGIVTGAAEILDDSKGKKQSFINQETDAELLRLNQSKQDNLTFDNAPTEGSNNPVKSAGVYAADKALSDAIEAILLLIPGAASALNKLVDMATMNSSISTATATFKGTYNVVTDLELAIDATHEQIAAALGNVISTADNNDYAFVQIPVSAESTDIRRTERYKFNGTAWGYEYDLNTSGFTAAQWAAINSGITLALVGKLIGLPTSSELQALLGQKQDTLTFDNIPTSGSNNPVKSGGVYSAINDEKTAREQLAQSVAGINGRLGDVEEVIPSGAAVNNKLVANNSMEAYVASIIQNITASFTIATADGHINLTLTQTNGRVASLTLTSSDIASAQALTALTGRVSTNESDIAALKALYNALQQSAPQVIEPTDTWPVANPSGTVIYRVIDRVNTPPQYYSDYMWNGTSFVLMATYNNAIDDEPTAGSPNLVKSGGVWASQQVVEQEIISKQNIDYGKNLFDKNSVDLILGKYIGWNHTIGDNNAFAITPYIPIKNGQTLYCNTAYTENVFNAFYDSNKNPIGQVVAGKSITCANNACYVRFTINANNINTCQVEIGSEGTSYEPYTRHKHLDELVLKIDGEIEKKALVKSDIRFGKNRYNSFADDIIEGAIINWQGDIVVDDSYNAFMVTGRIPIMEGETLFCNHGYGDVVYSASYDANGKVLDVSASKTRAYVQDAAYVRFTINLNDRYDVTQVEVGTSETDYVPYSEHKYLEQDIANNYIAKSIGKNKFNKNSDEIVRGYALGYDGKPFESSAFFITHYIPIKYLDMLYCNSQLTSSVFAVQYDRDYNIIGVNQAKMQQGLHKSAYVRFTCFLTALDSCQVEEGQEFTSYEEYTEFYGKNLNTDSLNKNILWLGTSIPAGTTNTVDINGKTMQNNYPKMIGEMLGCPIYNEAVGSSRLKTGSKSEVTQSNPLGWLSGPGQYYAIWVCLMMTIAQKQDLIDNWATYRVTYNWTDSPETLSETDKAIILACSYENKVLPYLNGTRQAPDVIVIDHGYNDGVPMTGDEFDEDITSQTDLQTFFGSYNFLVNLIRLYLPKVKIIQCCHFVSKKYDNGTFVDFSVVKGQKAIANYNGVPFIPLYDIDGWDSGRLITCNGYWEYDEAYESLRWGTWHNTGGPSRTYTPTTLHCCDTVHPHSDITGETNYELANCIAAWFKGNIYF